MERVAQGRLAKNLLRQEVVPSMGCTEPAALAFAAAAASPNTNDTPCEIRVTLDAGTYKNTLAAGLPGTRGKGPGLAAAAGTLIARPELGLRVFEAADDSIWETAERWERSGIVKVIPDPMARDVAIRGAVSRGSEHGVAVIRERHNNIVARILNGKPQPFEQPCRSAEQGISDAEIRRHLHSPEAILAFLGELDHEDLDFVEKGLLMNKTLAEQSLQEGWGLGSGKALMELAEQSGGEVASTVKAWVAAGVEARMAGKTAMVMTSGGSGNSGLTVSLGIWSAARALGIEKERDILKAIALGHLFNVAIKSRMGRVGPLCGGTLSSATAVGAAVCWLLGGDAGALDKVVRYMFGSMAGSLCDGAKPACAIKIAAGLSPAIDAARLAVTGHLEIGQEGLPGGCAENAFTRLIKLTRTAYVNTDISITSILQDRGHPFEPPNL